MDESDDLAEIDVDVLWLREWVEAGIADLERYLAKQAAFQRYLGEREE